MLVLLNLSVDSAYSPDSDEVFYQLSIDVGDAVDVSAGSVAVWPVKGWRTCIPEHASVAELVKGLRELATRLEGWQTGYRPEYHG